MGLWSLEAPALAHEVRHLGTLREDAHPGQFSFASCSSLIISGGHEELLYTTVCGIEFLSKLSV